MTTNNMLIAYKFGLLFKQLKAFYSSNQSFTESIEIKSKEEEQLYKSDVIAITKEDNIIRIYINTEENKDLLYYVTIIESTLRDKKVDAETIIFEIIIDNEIVDAFSIRANTLKQLLESMNQGAIKIEEADKSGLNTLKKYKLENNKLQRMIMLKGELYPVNKNEAMSVLMQSAIKQHEKSLVTKIKEIFFDNTFTPIAKYIRAVLAFNKSYNLEHLVVQGNVNIENLLLEYYIDRQDNNYHDRNNNYNRDNNNSYYNNRRNDRDYNNRGYNDRRDNNRNYDNRGYNNRRDNHRDNRHSYKPRFEKPSKTELTNMQKVALSVAVSVFFFTIADIIYPLTTDIISKIITILLMSIGAKLIIDKLTAQQKEKQFLNTLTPKYEYHLA